MHGGQTHSSAVGFGRRSTPCTSRAAAHGAQSGWVHASHGLRRTMGEGRGFVSRIPSRAPPKQPRHRSSAPLRQVALQPPSSPPSPPPYWKKRARDAPETLCTPLSACTLPDSSTGSCWHRGKRTDGHAFQIFIYNKQGSTASGKWRSLAGLLPGGGLKAGPPLDPPRPSIFPFPSARGRTGAGGLRNLRMSEKRRRTGAVWLQYGVGLRPSFYIGSLGGASPTLQTHFELDYD